MFRKSFIFFALLLITPAAALAQRSNLPLDEQIKTMDRQWIIEAYSSRDLKDFDRIVADDFMITGGNGKVLTKAEKRASVQKDYTDPANVQPGDIFRIEADSHKVRTFDKTAVSLGYITEKYVWKGTNINNRVYFTNVYLKRNGKWQIVASQFTNVKQS